MVRAWTTWLSEVYHVVAKRVWESKELIFKPINCSRRDTFKFHQLACNVSGYRLVHNVLVVAFAICPMLTNKMDVGIWGICDCCVWAAEDMEF